VHLLHHLKCSSEEDPYRLSLGIKAYFILHRVDYKIETRLAGFINNLYLPICIAQLLTASYFGVLLEFVMATLLTISTTIYYNYRSHKDTSYTPSYLFNIWVFGEGDHKKHHGGSYVN
jgi:fatty-acid desaturase